MAAPKQVRRREAQIAFEALAIEGALLSPEWLARVATLDTPGQSEADYRIPKGLNLRDEIGRYWRIAQAHWADLAAGRAAGADAQALAQTFVPALLRESFGFASLEEREAEPIGGREYPVRMAAIGGRVPIVIAPADSGLETASAAFGDGSRRRSAFGLLQEYLNAADTSQWGLASDGVTLRIGRDNASLTRPAWIAADLARIFTEERYADFAALWLLVHETRFGRPDQPVDESPLERWRKAGHEEGTRAREHLRRGVEEALLALAQGFHSHPDNQAVRRALQDGSLTRTAYLQELLRLVYRLIFLLAIEERGLLHPDGTPGAARALYAEGYSMARLRDRSVRRSAHDRFPDLWEATKIVFRALAEGEPRLGLPALAGLFGAGQCPTLDAAKLENRALLLAMFRLAWLRGASGLVRVNWRDMGPEELGSVYESLLELVLQITQDGRQIAFASGGETKGNLRKTSGSYYTPDSLVQVLLDSALEPVVKDTMAAHPEHPVVALLELSIVDPACGSGHFLLAAARRLAAHVARLQASGTPSAGEYRRALRQVIARCIYGVDLNPMAVELCKVSLWMEAMEPGLPLTFLDSHIQRGNSLLGTTPELMANGIPDAAWDPIEGDDRKVAGALKKRNKAAAAGQRGLSSVWSEPPEDEQATVATAVAALDREPDADAQALKQKESRWQQILESDAYRHQRFVADAWCAAFVWPKQEGPLAQAAPTNELWRQVRDRAGTPPSLTVETAEKLREEYSFFHWHLAFPQVFARGGFDLVLGNPPWEHVEIKEAEWFAARRPDIAGAVNAAARKRMIAALATEEPALFAEFAASLRAIGGSTHFARSSARFPLCAKGRINTYALFAEHNHAALGTTGRAGFIVPSGIVTDDTTKEFFQLLVDQRQLVSVFHFENEERIFPGVHHATRFVLLTVGGPGSSQESSLVFYARKVSELRGLDRRFTLTPSDFALLNPNTLTCPTFRSQRDAAINLAMYRRAGVLWNESAPDGNTWRLRFMQGLFNMASDSGLFRTRSEMEGAGFRLVGNRFERQGEAHLPLIEGKMVHHFDHRFGTYEGQTPAQENQGKLPEFDHASHADANRLTQPYYWVAGSEVADRLSGRWDRDWLIGWRDITGTEKQRTVIASLIPRAGVGHKFLLMLSAIDPRLAACLYSSLCSFPLDYAARQKVGGTSLMYFTMRQFPVLPPKTYAVATAWQHDTTLRDWLLQRVLELTYTAWDLNTTLLGSILRTSRSKNSYLY